MGTYIYGPSLTAARRVKIDASSRTVVPLVYKFKPSWHDGWASVHKQDLVIRRIERDAARVPSSPRWDGLIAPEGLIPGGAVHRVAPGESLVWADSQPAPGDCIGILVRDGRGLRMLPRIL